MHVCIRASETSVAWKPLITFPSKFGTMILGILLKKLIGTEFRGTFCFAQKWAQWAKNRGFFGKNLFFSFSCGNNLK